MVKQRKFFQVPSLKGKSVGWKNSVKKEKKNTILEMLLKFCHGHWLLRYKGFYFWVFQVSGTWRYPDAQVPRYPGTLTIIHGLI